MHAVQNSMPDVASSLAQSELRDFSYIVSHDLATEIRHVAEFSKLMVQSLEPESRAQLGGTAQIVVAASERCLAMLEQLRIYSHTQQSPVTLTTCSLREIVETAVLQSSYAINQSRAQIDLEVGGEIRADRNLLIDAVQRVLENATQFPRTGIELSIKIATSFDAQGGCSINVQDNGVGLEEALWEKAFRMFWRLDPKSGAHVGAGLPIVRRIMRQHGGDVSFTPSEVGANVRLWVPAFRGNA